MFESAKPPKGALLLLGLFRSEPDFPQIEGDMSEVFHQMVLALGLYEARRWYWREVFRNFWIFTKRPSTVKAVALAALSVFIFKFTVGLFFRWLQAQLYSLPRVPGLRLFLIGVFETLVGLLLGLLMSRLLRGHERRLRLAFTACFLVFLTYNHLLVTLPFDSRRLLSYVSSSLVLNAFWIGSTWISRRRLQPRLQ